MITATRAQSKASRCAAPMRRVTSNRWAISSGEPSTQWSSSSIGTTSAWPRAIGLIDMNTTQRSSRWTNVPGVSPATIRVKIVVISGSPPAGGEDVAGAVAALRTGQEADQLGQLLGTGHTPAGDLHGDHRLEHVVERGQEWRVDVAGADGVDPDAEVGGLLGD